MSGTSWRRWKYLSGVAVCFLFAWIAFVRKARVPLLSLVDLGFHELGHLVTRPLPEIVMIAAGSFAQIAVPVGLAAYFLLLRKDRLGGALCWPGRPRQPRTWPCTSPTRPTSASS